MKPSPQVFHRLFLAAIFLAAITAVILPTYFSTRASSSTSTPSSDTPYPSVTLENSYIPLSDGVRLAVTLYKPTGAHRADKFPAILEYLPYRKDDWAAARDYTLHSYFVKRGYVSARVDIRGTGASEGHPPDREYSQQEQKDGMEVIAWLARQPWCNGNVGMIGISWGGFNSIQMATRRPPALKAIIAVDATEQLFHDDVHYIDGVMHVDEYELGMDQELQLTAAPDFPTDEAHLAPRFDSSPWFLLYLHHQRDGEFWRAPLQQPVYDSIQIPVYLIGGFYDGYRDTIPRMMSKLKGPKKALLGPWNHTFPHDAVPGPAIEWRDSAVRWWDRWLKDKQNGIENEPTVTYYMQHWYAPNPSQPEIPGEWRTEDSWLPPERETQFSFEPGHLLWITGPQGQAEGDQLKYIPTTGIEAGFWWGDLANDQRGTDAYSLVYDSKPLPRDLAIFGLPRTEINVSSSAPLADWIVRLSDIAPDGTITLITGGALNGAQSDSATDPSDLEPGKTYPLKIDMHVTSWLFPQGHKIRLAVSNALWPMFWPTPYPMTTTVGLTPRSTLFLPEVLRTGDHPPEFAKPTEFDQRPGYTGGGDDWPGHWEITRDEVAHTARVLWKQDTWAGYPWGRIDDHEDMTYDASDDHPETGSVRGHAFTKVKLKTRELNFESHLELRSDAKNFYYTYRRDLTENGKLIRTKTWKDTIPRDHQ